MSKTRVDPKRVRAGLILASGLLAASALWLLRPLSPSGKDSARERQMLTPASAPEALPMLEALPTIEVLPTPAALPTLDAPEALRTPALQPAVTPPPVEEPSSPPPAPARRTEAAAPRSEATRVRAARPSRAAAAARAEPRRTPRMQIIEDRSPSMKILE